jgi:hypothetical protein
MIVFRLAKVTGIPSFQPFGITRYIIIQHNYLKFSLSHEHIKLTYGLTQLDLTIHSYTRNFNI